MICTNCNFNNLSDSQYCQSCGQLLTQNTNSITEVTQKTFEKLDDVIFTPKQKTHGYLKILGWGFVFVVCAFLGLLLLGSLSESNNSYEVSPEKTITSPTTNENLQFPIMYLSIEDLDSEWQGNTLYLTGVLRNISSTHAKNIRVRVDFYRDENQEHLIDTRYITISGVSGDGAYSFREPVYLNIADGRFWYIAQVLSAEYYK